MLFGASLAAASLGACGGGDAEPETAQEEETSGGEAEAEREEPTPEPPEEEAQPADPLGDDGGNVPLYGAPPKPD